MGVVSIVSLILNNSIVQGLIITYIGTLIGQFLTKKKVKFEQDEVNNTVKTVVEELFVVANDLKKASEDGKLKNTDKIGLISKAFSMIKEKLTSKKIKVPEKENLRTLIEGQVKIQKQK